jgi:uncharacterized Tic20 family protein
MQQPPLPAGALPDLTSDDRTWAALAHATVVLAVLSGGPLGPLAAFAIWLIKQDKSPYVRRQAMQSLIYQMVMLVITWSMWLAIGLLSAVLVGLCCIPFGLIVSLLAVIYGCLGAYECSQGRNFSYWLIGDLIA